MDASRAIVSRRSYFSSVMRGMKVSAGIQSAPLQKIFRPLISMMNDRALLHPAPAGGARYARRRPPAPYRDICHPVAAQGPPCTAAVHRSVRPPELRDPGGYTPRNTVIPIDDGMRQYFFSVPGDPDLELCLLSVQSFHTRRLPPAAPHPERCLQHGPRDA